MSPEALDEETGPKAQLRWQELEGEHFRFTDLPTEIRRLIFGFVLGHRIYLFGKIPDGVLLTQISGSVLLGQISVVHFHLGCCSIRNPILALLLVNKLTNQEVMQICWENTPKYFTSIYRLCTVLDAAVKPAYNWLNDVVLDFTLKEWFDFFGIFTASDLCMGTDPSFTFTLNMLHNLRSLQLRFRNPDKRCKCVPPNSNVTPICQDTMVDWVMTFAWPHVKDLPNVALGGSVKKNTKAMWNQRLALYRRGADPFFNHRAAEAAILSTPKSFLGLSFPRVEEERPDKHNRLRDQPWEDSVG
ncbi:hypothetical protein CFE70_000218 [Pyrenophora teres f. teres 0-1]